MTIVDQRALRLVPAPSEVGQRGLFCGHCARPPERDPGTGLASRVCEHCGLGLVLETSAGMVPKPADPFLVIDSSLAVCAFSRKAERLLKVKEPEAVHRPLSDFLVPADVEPPAAVGFSALVSQAAAGAVEPHTVAVRPTDLFGVRFWARIGSCGPPRAALILLASVG